jgi:polyribonucleotide nucleotidyltransferase
MIASTNAEAAKQAMDWITQLTARPEIGAIYQGKVVKIMEFGAFVEIMPGKDGLLHVSQIADHRVERVEDELTEGQTITVKLREIDDKGRLNLTRKGIDQQ